MMEFSGANRGYCFIMFTTEEEAACAVRELDKYEIYPGKRIGVVASTNNCRIYMSQLPRHIGTRTIIRRIYDYTEDIEKVCVYRNFKGFVSYVLISYNTHRSAAMGRKRLLPEAANLFKNTEVNIEWANPYISPSNVLEECGTLDENGRLEITKTYLDTVKCRKVIEPPKQRCETHDASYRQEQNLCNFPVQKGRAIKKCNSENNSLMQFDSTMRACENNQMKSVICSNCSSELLLNSYQLKNFGQAWNGNVSNNMKQVPVYENDCSNAILPSISTFLNREKRWKKWDVNHSDRVFRTLSVQPDQTSSNYLSRPINGRRFDSSLYHSDNNNSDSSSLPNTDCQSSVWNSTYNLVKKPPMAQPIANGNGNSDYVHGINYKHNIGHDNSCLSNNVLNSHSSNETNTLSINYQYNYEKWSMNSSEENNRIYFPYQDFSKSQNAYENVPRQVSSSDINQNDLFFSHDIYQHDTDKILQSSNLNSIGYSNDYHNQNHVSSLDPTSSQFNGRFTNKNSVIPAYPVNSLEGFVEGEGNFRRF